VFGLVAQLREHHLDRGRIVVQKRSKTMMLFERPID